MKKLGFILFALIFLLIGCGGEPEIDTEATIAAGIALTQTAAPTQTPIPTNTPEPTDTPAPTDTPEPTATFTAVPTDTPEPTNTPEPTPTEEPTAVSGIIQTEQKDGTTLYELPEVGVAMALPKAWQVIDLTAEDISFLFDTMGEQNESVSDLFTNDFFQNLVAAGIKFYAIDLSDASIFSDSPASINIATETLRADFTIEEYSRLVMAQLAQLLGVDIEAIEVEPVIIDNREAVKLSYLLTLTTPLGVEVENLNTQILVMEDNVVYVVTLGMEASLADDLLEPALEAVQTFRLLE